MVPNSTTRLPSIIRVSMRHRHRRRAHFGLTVDLRQMVVHHLRIFADQELAADREASILFLARGMPVSAAGSASPAAGADKDKFSFNDPLLTTIVGIRQVTVQLVGVALKRRTTVPSCRRN